MNDNSFFDAADEVEGSAGGNRRMLAIVGGATAAAVLAGGGYFLLAGGSAEEDTFPVPKGKAAAAKVAAPQAKTTTATKKGTVTIPAVSLARLGRDPFLALYIQPVEAAVTTTPTTTTPATDGTTTTPVTPGTTTAATYPLRLTRVYGAGKDLTAVFSVDGKTQNAALDSVFGRAQELKLRSLQQGAKGVWTAVVQVGDGQPFDAALGQTLYVR
jgi:hypothetical protein